MSTPHIYDNCHVAAEAGTVAEIQPSEKAIKHLRALRLSSGERFVLVDAPGHAWELVLSGDVPAKGGSIDVELVCERNARPASRLTLVQGISSGERMDQTIRQCTELGVARIIPLKSERSTVRLSRASGEKKLQRWQRVAQAAAEQSCQLHTPEITRPMLLAEALAELSVNAIMLLFWEEAEAQPFIKSFMSVIDELQQPTGGARELEVAVFVGPEGGFAGQEAAALKEAGAHVASLGSTILRTETAAVVACALTLQCLDACDAL